LIFSAATVLWAAGIFWVSSSPAKDLPNVAEIWYSLSHFAEYLVLGALAFLAVRGSSTASLRKPIAVAVAIASVYGVSDEFHQLFVSGRHADFFDWCTDTVGAAVGVILSAILLKHRLRKDNAGGKI
jgi:VanZ family protein